MTIPEIIQSVSAVAGRYSEPTFRRDCKRLKIQPVGKFRSVPRHYPPTTPALILSSRGFETALMPLPPLDTAASRLAKLPTLAQLRTVRKKARAVR